MSEYITVEQLAQRLQMSARFVRKHAVSLGGTKIGGGNHRAGCWRFQPAKVERYLEANAEEKRRPNETASRKNTKRVA